MSNDSFQDRIRALRLAGDVSRYVPIGTICVNRAVVIARTEVASRSVELISFNDGEQWSVKTLDEQSVTKNRQAAVDEFTAKANSLIAHLQPPT